MEEAVGVAAQILGEMPEAIPGACHLGRYLDRVDVQSSLRYLEKSRVTDLE